MPSKRTASRLPKASASTRTKRGDNVDDMPPVDSDFSDDSPSLALRRSPRKRQRVELEETKPVESGMLNLDLADDGPDEKPATKSTPATTIGLSKFVFSSSRPRRAAAKTPSKQPKIEETAPASPFTTDFKLELEETKPSVGSGKGKLSTSPSKKSTASAPRKQKAIVMELDKPHPAPPNWEAQYALIEEMRAEIEAPVDTMGCAKSMTGEGPLKDQRFGTLVSLMLSSQTKDEVTSAAVANLRRVLPGGLTVDSILAADPSVISDAIGKVGFWRRKTEYLQAAAVILRDKFDGDVPKTVDELCSLPGVGPKMAFLVLQVAWDINVGIGVDIHVHRITNRLGWHKPETKTPEQTRLNLQSWLPRNLHGPINPLLVGFGQVICLPVGPRCDVCLLSTQRLCPSARAAVSSKGKKPVIFTPKTKIAKTEAVDLPDLDAKGLVRLEDVKQEDIERDIGQPLIKIELEE